MNKFVIYFGIVLLLILPIVSADNLVQQNIGGTSANTPVRFNTGNNIYYGDNITANSSLNLVNLSVNAQKFGTPTGRIWIEIYNITFPTINSSLLARSNDIDISLFSAAAGGSYQNATFNNSYPLYSGQTLVYVWAGNNAIDGVNYIRPVEKAFTNGVQTSNPMISHGNGTWVRDSTGSQMNYQLWNGTATIIGTSLVLSAYNYYSNATINSFCINITGTYGCTTNGTVIFPSILTNSTQLWTIQYLSNESSRYFNETYTGVNVSNNLNRSMAQSIVAFTATNKITGQLISTANFTSFRLTNTTHYFDNANNYSINASAPGYINQTITYNTTALQNTTLNAASLYKRVFNVTANTYGGFQLKNFSATLTNAQWNYSETISTTSGNLSFNLDDLYLYNLTITTSNGDFPYNVTYTNLNVTPNLVFNYSIVNLTVRNAINNVSVSSFSAQINSTSFGTSQTRSTTNGTILYYATIDNWTSFVDASGFAYAYQNFTTSFGMNNVTVYVYTSESVNFFFYDEQSGSLLTNRTVRIDLISGVASYNRTTTNGTLYIDLISPDDYVIRYGSTNFTTRFSYLTITNRTTQNVSLYLLAAINSTNVTATVYQPDGRTVENALVKVLKYDISTNSYVVRGQILSNFEGQAAFDVLFNQEFYKFMVEYPVGTVALTTTPAYITSTEFPLILSGDVSGTEYQYVLDAGGLITYNSMTSNFRFDWSDTTSSVTQACIYAYRLQDNYTGLFLNSSCSTSASGSILLYVNNVSGYQYFTRGYLTIGGVQYFVDEEWTDLRNSTDFGQLGLVIAGLLTIAISFIFLTTPTSFVLSLPIGLTITQLTGITYFSTWVTVAVWIICIIIVFAMGRAR